MDNNEVAGNFSFGRSECFIKPNLVSDELFNIAVPILAAELMNGSRGIISKISLVDRVSLCASVTHKISSWKSCTTRQTCASTFGIICARILKRSESLWSSGQYSRCRSMFCEAFNFIVWFRCSHHHHRRHHLETRGRQKHLTKRSNGSFQRQSKKWL